MKSIAEFTNAFESMERAGAEQARRADDNHEWALRAERERDAERALADRLAELVQRDRDQYGGQLIDSDCDCSDCEYLEPIDAALAAWKKARNKI